jgi:hypothetical protein
MGKIVFAIFPYSVVDFLDYKVKNTAVDKPWLAKTSFALTALLDVTIPLQNKMEHKRYKPYWDPQTWLQVTWHNTPTFVSCKPAFLVSIAAWRERSISSQKCKKKGGNKMHEGPNSIS